MAAGYLALRGVHVLVDVGYVLLEMLPDQRELGTVDANHSKFADLIARDAMWCVDEETAAHLSEPPEIEHG